MRSLRVVVDHVASFIVNTLFARKCFAQSEPDIISAVAAREVKRGIAANVFVTDGHRGDGKCSVVHADEKLTAFVELKSASGDFADSLLSLLLSA